MTEVSTPATSTVASTAVIATPRPAAADIVWRFIAFDGLTVHELHDLLQLRSEIFVVEQTCVFQDIDGADVDAMHLVGTLDGRIVAYARCFDAGRKFAEASIGRIVTRDSLRGTGAGHVLVRRAIEAIAGHWGPQPIRIGAQQRLERFYAQHGFVQQGAPYIEDEIPHIEMLRG